MGTLVLVPTHPERLVVERLLAPALGPGTALELCGFGPIAAAARAAALVAGTRPERVLLVGIAGRLDDRLELAAAYRFDRVACYGVGVGSHDDFAPAGAVGWPHWPGDPAAGAPALGDLIACHPDDADPHGQRLLLTACAASATAADADRRRKAFPAAEAEDMEGFGVACACRLAGVPLDIVRGISNTAGDRDRSRWRTEPALEAAATLALRVIAEAS